VIEKVINFCWFGGKPLPTTVERCIDSWRSTCPDYEIVRWDESNFDLEQNDFIRNAYESKKWAFVSDYARLKILYEHGGIYLDTDVKLLKPLDPLLNNQGYMGIENLVGDIGVNSGLGMGFTAGHHVLGELVFIYDNLNIADSKWPTCVTLTTDYLASKGFVRKDRLQFVEGVTIYPSDYFCPMKPWSRTPKITANSYSVHLYDYSWASQSELSRRIHTAMMPAKILTRRAFRAAGLENAYNKLTTLAGTK